VGSSLRARLPSHTPHCGCIMLVGCKQGMSCSGRLCVRASGGVRRKSERMGAAGLRHGHLGVLGMRARWASEVGAWAWRQAVELKLKFGAAGNAAAARVMKTSAWQLRAWGRLPESVKRPKRPRLRG